MAFRGAVEATGLAVDGVGVGVIAVAIGVAGVAFGRGLSSGLPFDSSYRQLRQSRGRGVLLGLELLVAGDIIRTVAVAPTLTGVGVLAMIVAIRTLLSFSLEVELTGRWIAHRWTPTSSRVVAAALDGRGHPRSRDQLTALVGPLPRHLVSAPL